MGWNKNVIAWLMSTFFTQNWRKSLRNQASRLQLRPEHLLWKSVWRTDVWSGNEKIAGHFIWYLGTIINICSAFNYSLVFAIIYAILNAFGKREHYEGIEGIMKIIDNSVVFNMYQMKVKDEFRSSFNEVGKRNMVTSSTIESGTLGMYNTMNDAGENLLFELYDDQKAYDKHVQSQQSKDFQRVVSEGATDVSQVELVPEFLGEQDVSLNTTTDNRLWVNVVRFTVKDGKQDQFKQILIPYLKKAMKAETEILVCYVSHVKDESNRWMTFQVFQNDDTFKKYVNSDGFHQVLDELTPLFEERELEQLDGQVLINQGHY